MKRTFIILSLVTLLAMSSTTLAQQFHRMPCIGQVEGNSTSMHKVQRKITLHQSDALVNAFGTPEIVVCLASCADNDFTVAQTDDELVELFEKFFNSEEGGAGKNTLSVRSYFEAVSGGQFSPHFNIMRPVKVSKPCSEYTRYAFMQEAIDSIDDQVAYRVSQFDRTDEQDGVVDGVIVVFAGSGKNSGDGFLWPCTWSDYLAVSKGNVCYAAPLICPELLQKDVLNGIGVYAHEFSHALGLPDFYDTSSPMVYSGMDYWDLMDYGEYTNNGFDPTAYTAYEKAFMGWMKLKELNEPTTIEGMRAVADGGDAYIIYNEGNRAEYYILENLTNADPLNTRLTTGLGEGLIIYHVTEDEDAWKKNIVNSTALQHMTIIPANGHFELSDNYKDSNQYFSEMRGHLWPLKNQKESVIKYYGLTAGNDSLTDYSARTEPVDSPAIDRCAPAATLNLPNTDGTYYMHKPITDIKQSEDGKTISFNFMGGTATGIDETICTLPANRQRVIVYTLDGTTAARTTSSALSAIRLHPGIYVCHNQSTGRRWKMQMR